MVGSALVGIVETARRHAVYLRLSAIFAALSILIGKTNAGHSLELTAFNWISNAVGRDASSEVVVVAIDGLPSGLGHPTNPDHLRTALERIARDRPAAIGVDIDMSPGDDSVETTGPRLFKFCDSLTKGKAKMRGGKALPPVPVFLGVMRSWPLPRHRWFPYPGYDRLAAFIGVYDNDPRYMPRQIESANYASPSGPAVLKGMGEALAEAYLVQRGRPLPGPSPRARWLNRTAIVQSNGARALVSGTNESIRFNGSDYVSVPTIMNYRGLRSGPVAAVVMRPAGPELVHCDADGKVDTAALPSFQGKMVILGDFKVRDKPENPLVLSSKTRVFWHASAADTFAQSPVFELTPITRVVLDFILAVGLLGLHALLEFVFKRTRKNQEPSRDAGEERLWEDRFDLLTLLSAVLVVAALVYWFNILWLDYISTTLALWLHPYVQRHVRHRLEKRDDATAEKPQEPGKNGGVRGLIWQLVHWTDGRIAILFVIAWVWPAHTTVESPAERRYPPPPETQAAIVQSGRGFASRGSGPRMPIGPGQKVYPGWELRPDKELTIKYGDNQVTKVKRIPAGLRIETDNPFVDKKERSVDLGNEPYTVRMQFKSAAEDSMFVRAGRAQGAETKIFSPPNEGKAWPARQILRWDPQPAGTKLTLILRKAASVSPNRSFLPPIDVVDDGTGVLESQDLREQLDRIRTPDSEERFSIELTGPRGLVMRSTFKVTSRQEETELDNELSAWNSLPLLQQYFYRASTLQHHSLFAQAAEEMEEALELAPENAAVRRTAAWEYIRTGNVKRARQIDPLVLDRESDGRK